MTFLDNRETENARVLAAALARTSRQAVAGDVPESALSNPLLLSLARSVLAESLGSPRVGPEPFPLTLWRYGAEHVGKRTPGVSLNITFSGFADLLQKRSLVVAKKRAGWVVEPTTNADGKRTNASTLTLHAAFLDCDDRGDWDPLLGELRAVGLASIAYRSGGHREGAPKWRLVLPFSSPIPVRTETERAAWKKLYHRLRVLLGALGGLRREGFDPRTDAPSIPWFLTERRSPEDPPREVVLLPGRSLDLVALAMALPLVEDEEPKKPRRARAPDESRVLSGEEEDALVSALASTTRTVPRGRRDLYLALPGALLDRGVPPDDVLAICERVSASYPRRHEDKHRDNVRAAKTTIEKYLARDPTYTRIGTLQASHPEVARVLDTHLPDPVEEAVRRSMTKGAAIREESRTSVNLPEMRSKSLPESKPKRREESLRKRLGRLANERSASPRPKQATAGAVLRSLLDGGSLAAFRDIRVRERAVQDVFDLVGFDIETSFDEVLRVVLGEVDGETYCLGASAHAAARERRRRWDEAAPARLADRVAKRTAYDRQGI